MQIGVVFPQTEIGPDPAAVARYARRAEELGYRHLLAYDHVLGADPAVHQGWDGPYRTSAPGAVGWRSRSGRCAGCGPSRR